MSNESKYTPGPWHVFHGHETYKISRDRSGHELIARVEDHAPTDGDMELEAKANAKLIAAAPELLEVLLALRDHLEVKKETTATDHALEGNAIRARMYAAIEKASNG